MLTPHIKTLSTGLRVIQIPMQTMKSVTVLALANTGSRYEDPSQFGIAHFFEHMVFKGTEAYPTAQDLAIAVDSIGANFNAFTSKEYTGYYVHAASQHLTLALDVVSDMLLTPRLRQEDIDREKGVIIEEINMYVDTPPSHIANKFDQMVFKQSGLEHDILGFKETVSSMTTADFESFLQKWYGLSNIVLIVAGDSSEVNTSATLEKIEAAFAKQPNGARQNSKEVLDKSRGIADSAFSLSTERAIHIEHRATEQAHFIAGWSALKRKDPRRFALGLLNTILGSNMSSRLFTEVREKRGLCYYVNSSVDQYHDVGLFGASAGVDPKRIDEAIKVTLDEFYQVATGKRPITSKELEMSKEYIAGKLVLGLEDSQSVAQFFGMKELLLGEIESPESILEKYRAVQLEDIAALAAEIINSNQTKFAIIGPYTQENDHDRFAALMK